MHDFLVALLGEKGQVALAGAAGGLVRWLTLRARWQDGVISIVVGSLCALYLGPLAQPAVTAMIGTFVLDPASRASFSGFILGLGGVSVSGLAMDFWKAKKDAQRPKDKDRDDEHHP